MAQRVREWASLLGGSLARGLQFVKESCQGEEYRLSCKDSYGKVLNWGTDAVPSVLEKLFGSHRAYSAKVRRGGRLVWRC